MGIVAIRDDVKTQNSYLQDNSNNLKPISLRKTIMVSASIVAALLPTHQIGRVSNNDQQLYTFSTFSTSKTLPYNEFNSNQTSGEISLLSSEIYGNSQQRVLFYSQMAYNKEESAVENLEEANLMAGKKLHRTVDKTINSSVVYQGRMTKRPRVDLLENDGILQKKTYNEINVPMSIEYAGRLPKRARV